MAEPQLFGPLLQRLRQDAGLSGNALARAAGIDPSYLNRIERGEREPPRREAILALARVLRLSIADSDRLLVAGGQLPEVLQRLGPLDPTVLLVADILGDPAIPGAERAEFREILRLMARRWRSGA